MCFGIAREIVCSDKLLWEFSPGDRVRDLKKALNERYDALAALGNYLIALDQEIADEDSPLDAVEEIAIIPPVSGG